MTRTQRLATFVLAGFLTAALSGAAPLDVLGWEKARWGMTAENLDHAFGSRLHKLTSGIRYKDRVATRAIDSVWLGPERFVAVFQMDDKGGGLAQVLLRFSAGVPPHGSYARTRRALEESLGPPGKSERETADSSDIPWFRIVDRWTFPTTTVVLTYFEPDFEDTARDKSLTVRYFPSRAKAKTP